MNPAPLYGLVLAGGRSTRMQRDKANLEYAGKPQLARAMELIAPLVVRAFVSVRPDQQHDPQRAAYRHNHRPAARISARWPAFKPHCEPIPRRPGWCWRAICRS
jgi:molybdopterin-guanine dinucleotide biosynthesis protein A